MLRFALTTILVTASLLAQATNGTIAGTATAADTRRPLSGAIVMARSIATSSTIRSVVAAADGSFQLQNLPAGTYSLCIKAADDGYLDPCDWGHAASSLTLGTGQTSTANLLSATAGSVVKIRIQDPTQFLFQKGKSGYLPDLMVGVFGPKGLFYPAHVVNRDTGGLNMQLTVPFDTPLSLSVVSHALKLTDSAGVALPAAGAATAFQHATGDANPASFTYTVTGANP